MNVVKCSFCCSVNLYAFAWEKLHKHFSVSAVFPAQNQTKLIEQQDMFFFNHASALYTNNGIMKNVDE